MTTCKSRVVVLHLPVLSASHHTRQTSTDRNQLKLTRLVRWLKDCEELTRWKTVLPLMTEHPVKTLMPHTVCMDMTHKDNSIHQWSIPQNTKTYLTYYIGSNEQKFIWQWTRIYVIFWDMKINSWSQLYDWRFLHRTDCHYLEAKCLDV